MLSLKSKGKVKYFPSFLYYNEIALLWLITDEGVYECHRTTVFGLTKPEVAALVEQGFTITDKNPSSEGQEIETSGFNVMFTFHICMRTVKS